MFLWVSSFYSVAILLQMYWPMRQSLLRSVVQEKRLLSSSPVHLLVWERVRLSTLVQVSLVHSVVQRSLIFCTSTNAGTFAIILTWTPTTAQFGPQGFCAGAIDNTGVQSSPWCITFLVGFNAPNLQKPLFVQHSASPLGTVFANQSIFAIQSTTFPWRLRRSNIVSHCWIGVNGVGVNRPGRNGTFVRFIDATLNNTQVLAYDCGWSTMVTYSGSTIIIYAPYAWVPGHRYYVTFDSGECSEWSMMMSIWTLL